MKRVWMRLGMIAMLMWLTACDDPRQSDRREKPRCTTQCDTCYRCVEQGDRPADPCRRYETFQCNCHEVCS